MDKFSWTFLPITLAVTLIMMNPMKRKHIILCVLGMGLFFGITGRTQTLNNLHNFSYNGTDGSFPDAGLVISGKTLYGMAGAGGSFFNGTVFAVKTDGTVFTNLHSFNGDTNDGSFPYDELTLVGNTLYGTTSDGGASHLGMIFSINTDGTGFTNLYSFTYDHGFLLSDGCLPYASLLLAGGTFYGTTTQGGTNGFGTTHPYENGYGTVFAINTNGTGFERIYSFTATAGANNTNSDGATPSASLVLSGNTLFGTARNGGTAGNGTVFAVNTDGTGFTNFHSFTATSGTANTNSDGDYPTAKLILSGDTLYGVTLKGGPAGNGVIFAIKTNGLGFTILHAFSATIGSAGAGFGSSGTNSDGARPAASFFLSGNVLYGTASSGGSEGNGTVFAMNTDGSGFTTLYNFTTSVGSNGGIFFGTNPDGLGPNEVILSGNILYGTTIEGGTNGYGTAFSLSVPPPPLTITFADANNIILTWATYAPGVTLQGTTNLGVTAAWTTVSPAPVVLNGQNVVTNLITGTQQFFRLSQ